jgi:MSHA pilin protein MshD
VFITGPAASADPQIRAQARAIAEGYMEEILLKAYRDPDGTETAGGGVEAGEDRATYDDVWDYCDIGNDNDCSGGDEDPTDQDGNPMAGGALDDYQVAVVIDGSPGSGPATVRVTVDHTSARVSYELASQRAEY